MGGGKQPTENHNPLPVLQTSFKTHGVEKGAMK